MTITKIISYIITVSMIGVILWAQGQVPIFDSPIPKLPWGIVSLVDLYAGFILFSIWIFYKEPMNKSIVWVFFVMILGNLATALYVLYSFRTSEGDINKFFLGKNS